MVSVLLLPLWLSADTIACVINDFWWRTHLSICIGNNFRITRPRAMYKFRNISQLITQIDKLKRKSAPWKKRERCFFYRNVRRFLCGAPIRPSCRYCFVCRLFFALLSRRYCQRRVNANISAVLNIAIRLEFWTKRNFLNQHKLFMYGSILPLRIGQKRALS